MTSLFSQRPHLNFLLRQNIHGHVCFAFLGLSSIGCVQVRLGVWLFVLNSDFFIFSQCVFVALFAKGVLDTEAFHRKRLLCPWAVFLLEVSWMDSPTVCLKMSFCEAAWDVQITWFEKNVLTMCAPIHMETQKVCKWETCTVTVPLNKKQRLCDVEPCKIGAKNCVHSPLSGLEYTPTDFVDTRTKSKIRKKCHARKCYHVCFDIVAIKNFGQSCKWLKMPFVNDVSGLEFFDACRTFLALETRSSELRFSLHPRVVHKVFHHCCERGQITRTFAGLRWVWNAPMRTTQGLVHCDFRRYLNLGFWSPACAFLTGICTT